MPAHPATSAQRSTLLKALTTAALIATVTSSAKSQTQTLYVDDDAPTGGNGTTWNAAFRELQDALDIANQTLTGTVEIRIAQGTYIPPARGLEARAFRIGPPNILSASTFHFARDHPLAAPPRLPIATHANRDIPQLTSGVSIKLQGGYAGITTAAPDTRDPAAFISILSADVLGDDNGTPNSRLDNLPTVLTARMAPFTALEIDALDIAAAASTDQPVVALHIGSDPGARPTIRLRNSRFHDIHSGLIGYAARIDTPNPFISDCRFEHMTLGIADPVAASTAALSVSGGNGGTAPGDNNPPAIARCEFRNITGAASGAVITYLPTGTARFEDCRFESCTAMAGAAIFAPSPQARVSVLRCQFDANTALSGGAINADDVVATDSVFRSNTASFGGACFVDRATITRCEFSDNAASESGGAIAASTLDIYSSRFESNASNKGGALRAETRVYVTDSTFKHNTATRAGGALEARLAEARLIDCVFDRNTALGSSGQSQTNVFGGGVRLFTGYIARCKFFGNVAASTVGAASGGAVYAIDTVQVANSIFSGNRAEGAASASAGALAVGARSLVMLATFCQNSAEASAGSASGGGIAAFGQCYVESAILWDNSINGVRRVSGADAASVQYQHLIAASCTTLSELWPGCGAGNLNGCDPLLKDPDGSDNMIGTLDDDVSISSVISPAIDSSSRSTEPDYTYLDADRQPRRIDALEPSTSATDRGALEFQGNPACVPFDNDRNGIVNVSDLETLLARFGSQIIPGVFPDFNHDGIVNTQDLIRFLSHFGCSRWS
jgi:predicted outer membrane repeat protein